MRLLYTKPKLKDMSQGSRIAFARQFRLMTQDNVSDKLGLTGECKRRTMTRYEKGNRNPKEDRAREIANILDVNYNAIKKYGKVIKSIGFSGHHIGTAVDISAYTLGATVIERHFTLDKSLKGTDQKVALTKEEFEELILNIDNVRKALSYKNKDVLDVEIKNKEKLKW